MDSGYKNPMNMMMDSEDKRINEDRKQFISMSQPLNLMEEYNKELNLNQKDFNEFEDNDFMITEMLSPEIEKNSKQYYQSIID